MTAPAFTERSGEACARCDTDMVITYDAPRRPRKRCPKCDGVSKKAAPNPDMVLVPVQLVPLATVASALPAIEPWQPRCQLCAHGVETTERFCLRCVPKGAIGARAYHPKPSHNPRCRKVFIPNGPRALFCEACR